MSFFFKDLHKLFWDNITDSKLQCSNRVKFLRNILPDPLFIAATEAKAKEYTHKPVCTDRSSTLQRFYDGNADNSSKNFTELIISDKNECSGEEYTYEDCKYRIEVKNKWKILIQKLSTREISKLISVSATAIRTKGSSNSYIKDRQKELLDLSVEDRFAFFTLLAGTYYYWENEPGSENANNLLELIFPPKHELSKEPGPLGRKKNDAAKKAEVRLKGIQNKIERISIDSAARDNCLDTCKQILSIKDLKDNYLIGKTCYILYKCYLSINETYAYDYLAKSCQYEYGEALSLRSKIESSGLLYPIEENRSTFSGYCIYNTDNTYYRLFEKSVPGDWETIAINDYIMFAPFRGMHEKTEIPFVDGNNKIYSGIDLMMSGSRHKFLLFDEDMRKNFVDLLSVLEFVRKNSLYSFIENIDIFIRCNEEIYSPLIDTAQKNLEGHVIRIHILDDDKMGAQQLLSHHPLFYPIRNQGSGKPTLHFVIIGSDKCAEWLLRESFWLLTFPPQEAKAQITILAPNADEFYNSIVARLPGLRSSDDLSEYFPRSFRTTIKHIKTDLNNNKLNTEIEKLLKSKDFLYFAVSTGDDEKNLALGIFLREYLIRNAVSTPQDDNAKGNTLSDNLNELPPVAFRCKDENIAYLSRRLIVKNLDSGDSWYNNYALIPFGAKSERYTWQNLDGGLIEQLSLCTHLEYSDIQLHEEPYVETEAEQECRKTALKKYYGRQYNKDSSMSVALSLPYRLFNIRDAKRSSACPEGNRLIREAWNILDFDAYINPKTLAGFSEQTEFLCGEDRILSDQSVRTQIDKLSSWEQVRWSRFMLSRGWMPASVLQSKAYTSGENKNHQLYIAKLHPAIREYEQLASVERELQHDFKIYNRRNLMNTCHILRLDWLEQEKQLEREDSELSIDP